MVQQQVSTPEHKIAYGMFAGSVDNQAVSRFMNSISSAVANGVSEAHVLFQSNGGLVGDGVCLFNLFRGVQFDLILYNGGTVCSAAAIAFLGARHRRFSRHATFMIHRSQVPMQNATTVELKHLAHSTGQDDDRMEAIIRECSTLTEDQWNIFHGHNLWLSAEEALAAGIATAIGDFAPPRGEPVAII